MYSVASGASEHSVFNGFALLLCDGQVASDNTVRVWDRGQCIHTLRGGHTGSVWTLVQLRDGTL